MDKVFLLYVKDSNTDKCMFLGIFSSRELAELAILSSNFTLGTFEEFVIDEFSIDEVNYVCNNCI